MDGCHTSKITIMQLFHELKQQFPTLPDHVISECMLQNGYDREICTKSLRATQETRPPPGAFPPPAPQTENLDLPTKIRSLQNFQKRQQRPVSLDIATKSDNSCTKVTRRHSCPKDSVLSPEKINIQNSSGTKLNNSGFEVNVNVACSPVSGARTDYSQSSAGEQRSANSKNQCPRSFTSVSLVLRPPASEPQPPVNISSKGPSLTYSASSLDNHGFQSRLQISIGPGKIGGIAASRTRPSQINLSSGSGTMSAPTTPMMPPATSPINSSPTSPNEENIGDFCDPEYYSLLNQVPESKKKLILEQFIRKDRLERALKNEVKKLEVMKKDVDCLIKPQDPNISRKELERRLRSDIYQLQLECDKLAIEVDQKTDPQVPLGETNEEFYQGIYTGQQYLPKADDVPPPLPDEPPAWEPLENRNENPRVEEPSWICRRCTFNNHPLMDKCEECNSKKVTAQQSDQTQDIHITVTHQHNFPPRRVAQDRPTSGM